MSRISSFFNFLLSFFGFSKLPGSTVSKSSLKCISSLNLSPAYKNFFTISFILYFLYKISLTKGNSLRIGIFIAKLLFNILPPDFLLTHTTHFRKSIGFSLFAFATLGFLLSVFLFYTSNN